MEKSDESTIDKANPWAREAEAAAPLPEPPAAPLEPERKPVTYWTVALASGVQVLGQAHGPDGDLAIVVVDDDGSRRRYVPDPHETQPAPVAAAPQGAEPACTGRTAFWCPVHGDCTCSRDTEGECMFDAADCPLHNDTSQHAEDDEGPPAAAPQGAGPSKPKGAVECPECHHVAPLLFVAGDGKCRECLALVWDHAPPSITQPPAWLADAALLHARWCETHENPTAERYTLKAIEAFVAEVTAAPSAPQGGPAASPGDESDDDASRQVYEDPCGWWRWRIDGHSASRTEEEARQEIDAYCARWAASPPHGERAEPAPPGARWLSIEPEGFEEHDTAEEARAAAASWLEEPQPRDDSWHENIEATCWGYFVPVEVAEKYDVPHEGARNALAAAAEAYARDLYRGRP